MAESTETQTIATACRRFSGPIEYVRRVLENMRQHPTDATVRVSMVDTDKRADYIIDEVMDANTGQSEPMQGYDGTTHRQLSLKKHRDGWSGWSRDRMDRSQVSALLGELRNYKPIDKLVSIPPTKKGKN